MVEEEVRKLVLPYDHTQLPALLASIKNEEELRTFVLEYAEAKGTSLTENQVNTLIAIYITEHNIGSGNSQSGTGLTPEQAQKLSMLLTDGDGEKYLGDDGNYHNIPRDGVDGQNGTNGVDGSDGVGISNITASQSGENVTLTISLTDGTSKQLTFTAPQGSGGTSIDDTTTTNASTWSSEKIASEIGNLPIGIVKKRNNIFTDVSGNILSEWDIVITPTSNNDFNSTLEYTYEVGNDTVNLTKQANNVPMVILNNVNGYTEKLLVDGLTENSKVFLLGNTPSSSEGNVDRPYGIYYNLKKKSGKTISAGDFKLIFEMDIAILEPTNTTIRKGSGYDVFELDMQDPSVVGYPYIGILDGRNNGYMRCAGTETRSGFSNGFMYKYLGNFPIGEWVTLRIEVNGLDHVSTYVNDVLYDDDLNNPIDRSTTPDGENGNIGLTFGDFDYVICKAIRCMNCNKEKFEGV